MIELFVGLSCLEKMSLCRSGTLCYEKKDGGDGGGDEKGLADDRQVESHIGMHVCRHEIQYMRRTKDSNLLKLLRLASRHSCETRVLRG